MHLLFFRSNSVNVLLLLLVIQAVLDLAVLFDVPVARQVFGFLYLTFVPGFLFAKLIRVKTSSRIETVLFSVGISVALVMLLGLFMDNFGSVFAFSKPLSMWPLLVFANAFVIMIGVVLHFRGEYVDLSVPDLWSKSWIILLVLPLLSVIAVMQLNLHTDNSIMLMSIPIIAVIFSLGVISKKLVPERVYPYVVFAISLSLLLSSSLISRNIVNFGSDASLEYLVFKDAHNAEYWSGPQSLEASGGYGRVSSMLSVTILPIIYVNLLSMDSMLLFKLLFPFLFSFAIVGAYHLWQKHVGRKYAFVAAFLMMAQTVFYSEMIALNRQVIGELFFVLLLIIVLNNKGRSTPKLVCFMLFSFGLIVSHYALAEIFLFFILIGFFASILLKRPLIGITPSLIVFFSTLMFLWYVYTSNSSVLWSFVEFGTYVVSHLEDFLNPASRGTDVLRGLGVDAAPTIWNTLSRGIAYITQGCLVVGFAGVFTKRVKHGMTRDFVVYSFAAIIVLVATIVVPGLAKTLNMSRFYHILLFLLAPFLAIGVRFFVGKVSKHDVAFKSSILLVVLLVSYFFFQTGFVYELVGVKSYSLSLSMPSMEPSLLYGTLGYTTDKDAAGGRWLVESVNYTKGVYADIYSTTNVLQTHALLRASYGYTLSNTTELRSGSAVYLSFLNTVEGTVISDYLWNVTEIYGTLEGGHLVYSNGANEVYGVP